MMFSKRDMTRILRESEKYNVVLLFASQEEALSATNEFRKEMPQCLNTGNKTVLRTAAGFRIHFINIQSVKNRMDGIRAKVIICIPVLEQISAYRGGVCTMKQFREQEENNGDRI